MKDKLLLVTAPDDVLLDGFRILLFDLSVDQKDIVSRALTRIKQTDLVIVYIWNTGNPYEWMLDKKLKSDLIIFSSGHLDEMTTGYLAAQRNSYYFGNIRNLTLVNKKVIYTQDDCLDIINSHMDDYER
jgi:hypothetical protein